MPTPAANLVNEFLNPKSMLTPGLCGGVTMMISSTLAAQFHIAPNISGLVLSFMLGLIAFKNAGPVLWQRCVYWLLNSLIIFSTALGTNQVVVQHSTPSPAPVASAGNAAPAVSTPLPQGNLTAGSPTVPNAALFTNWLDGTVHKREELLGRVQKIEPAKASSVLKDLGVHQVPGPNVAPEKYLGQWVANARTASELSTFEKALDKSAAH